MNHPNIVKILKYENETYFKTNGSSKEVFVIVLELVRGGELFDFVCK